MRITINAQCLQDIQVLKEFNEYHSFAPVVHITITLIYFLTGLTNIPLLIFVHYVYCLIIPRLILLGSCDIDQHIVCRTQDFLCWDIFSLRKHLWRKKIYNFFKSVLQTFQMSTLECEWSRWLLLILTLFLDMT